MAGSAFLDTNVLIYSVAGDHARSEVAEGLLAAGGVVSVQILNEFVAVARRKLDMSWDDVTEALDAIRTLCSSTPAITTGTHDAALRIAKAHGFHIYDALVIASALESGCDTIYTEDLQDGQVVEGRLTIRNPFKTR